MKRVWSLAVLLSIGGCREESGPASRSAPPIPDACIMVSDYVRHDSTHCIAQAPKTSTAGVMNCGTKGTSTKLEWGRLGQGALGDRYKLIWNLYPDRMPEDTPLPTTTLYVTEVEFTGKTLVVWENATQRVVLYAGSPENPPVIDEQTLRHDSGHVLP